MANAEEYNDNLHEEVHQLHNLLLPLCSPSAPKMYSEKEEEDQKMEVAESDDEEGDGSGMDSVTPQVFVTC